MGKGQARGDGQARECAIMPLVDFKADWEGDSYDFDPAVTLLRLQPGVCGNLRTCLEGPYDAGDSFWDDLTWLLVIRFYFTSKQAIEDLDGGPPEQRDVPHVVLRDFADSFLTTLNLIRLHRACAPIILKGEVSLEGSVPDVCNFQVTTPFTEEYDHLYLRDYGGPLPGYEPRPYYGEADSDEFQDPDWKVLPALWQAVARVRELPSRAEESCQEDFTLLYSLRSEESRNKTRLGRALGLFEDGVHARPLHAFITMVFVLETLYGDDGEGVTHKLRTRISRLLGQGRSFEERKNLYERAKKVYDRRCDVAHGRELIQVKDCHFKNAFDLAARSLRCILCCDKLLGLFAAEESHKKKGEVEEFFRILDVGSEADLRRFLWGVGPEVH